MALKAHRGGFTLMRVAVTTSRRPSNRALRRAERYAHALGVPFLSRKGRSFADLLTEATGLMRQPPAGFLVVREPELVVWTHEGILQYHPNMALHRVAALRRGEADTMVSAMELQPGDRFLDCTAGLASDAVVASYAVGPVGRVVALESVAVLSLLLKVGLARYPAQGAALTAAMRRVRVRHCEHTRFLSFCAPHSFDVVYFDPMFDDPVRESHGIAPLRPLADYAPLSMEALELGRQVATRMVVVKERRNGPLQTQLSWDDVRGGRKSRIVYLVKQATSLRK